MSTRDDISAGEPMPARQGYMLATLVLVASLSLVVIYAMGAGNRERALAEARLAVEAEQVVAGLRQQLLTYELITRGGVSLLAAVDRPSPRQWRNYAEGLDLPRRFPAMLGLCYAAAMSPAQLQDFQLEQRQATRLLFRVDPPGARAEYGPIVLLEPQVVATADAVGFDMLTEPVQAAAMSAARASASARITAPMPAVQQGAGPGLVIYAPVYRSGIVPANASARTAALAGWVCAPFRLDLFVANALPEGREGFSMRIVDIGEADGPTVEATEAELPVFPVDGAAPVAGTVEGASHSVVEEVYGRRWRLDFHQDPGPDDDAGLLGPTGTIYVGMLASLLLFALAMILARTQSRAQQIAVRMSESYRRSEQRFRAAMRFSAIGKALLDRDGRIIDSNLALANILRASPEELLGRDFEGLFTGFDSAAETRAREATGSAYRVTRELRREDGDLRHVHLTYAQVPGEEGQGIASLVQVEDISDRLRAEARVLALNRTLEARVVLRTRELTRANEELESFAYTISHDLRAPLRAIDGFSRMVVDRHGDAFDETGRAYIARVRAATARMGELIDALLKMSRVSRGELKREPLDLSAMADDLVAELRQAEPGREVDVRIEPGLHASGDSALVRNLLGNLLANAWKFTRDATGARIGFHRVSEGGHDWFEIADNGVGFDQAYANKLFRPFQRLHAADAFSGEGIGLASVKRIIERHGGTITGAGVPGQGARFRFTLPDDPG
ncbi:CHASE domain-containing protein [Luteimonas sp. MC1750]|uniref:CHASE domain-containing protein n=1 Tax=Luteimonas sp. MC1750 TaxID=2799326 RepID=UPI0018F0FE8D|nr:CHASE domain-containing protein [Luteimonas sp. MC1750]MBJ6984616.1 CHASE domain-containing protein [Luteimonas sp. MC1750]QQO04780.1 CHASE domain-containing protein [Luteimonas sp. MC1750]